MAYFKPQSPIKKTNGDGIYPPTTADQVIKADGTRLEQNGEILADRAREADIARTVTTMPTAKEIGAVDKTGDTMTGPLKIEGDLYPTMALRPKQPNTQEVINQGVLEGNYRGAVAMSAYEDLAGNTRRVLQVNGKSYKKSMDDAILLRTCEDGQWAPDERVYHSGMETPIPPETGGTGVHSLQELREEMGIPAGAKVLLGTTRKAFNNNTTTAPDGLIKFTGVFDAIEGADDYLVMNHYGYCAELENVTIDQDTLTIEAEVRNTQNSAHTSNITFIIGGYKTL